MKLILLSLAAVIFCGCLSGYKHTLPLLLTSEYRGPDSSLSVEEQGKVIDKCDGVVASMGYDPTHFLRGILRDGQSYIVDYQPAGPGEVDGRIMIKVGESDFAVLELARSKDFYVKDTTLAQEERSQLLRISEAATKDRRTDGRSYREHILSDDSSHVIFYYPHPNPELDSTGGMIFILGGVDIHPWRCD